MSDEPIALIHWGDSNVEDEEIEEIKLLLEATLFGGDMQQQAVKAPHISEARITLPSVKDLRSTLSTFLAAHPELQAIYITAHGNTTGLSYNMGGTSTITYAEFADLLFNCLRHDDCIHLVFGSCEAMSPSVAIEQYMPSGIYAVSGFTACPLSTDVAGLMASIVQDDVILFDHLSSTNASVCTGKGQLHEKIATVISKWGMILDAHKENSAREVKGLSGVAVVTATRDEQTGTWDRRTTNCTVPKEPRVKPEDKR